MLESFAQTLVNSFIQKKIAFVEVEKGSRADLDKIVGYLQEVMKSDPNLVLKVEKLAFEIQYKSLCWS